MRSRGGILVLYTFNNIMTNKTQCNTTQICHFLFFTINFDYYYYYLLKIISIRNLKKKPILKYYSSFLFLDSSLNKIDFHSFDKLFRFRKTKFIGNATRFETHLKQVPNQSCFFLISDITEVTYEYALCFAHYINENVLNKLTPQGICKRACTNKL